MALWSHQISPRIKFDRTVRLGLWDGEEAGHLGSRAYVKEHLGNARSMELTPDHETFSVYFNFDTGSGRTRGILTQANDMVKPVFLDHIAPQDLMVSAAFMASLVYQAAIREELMPREPLPAPQPLPQILQD